MSEQGFNRDALFVAVLLLVCLVVVGTSLKIEIRDLQRRIAVLEARER